MSIEPTFDTLPVKLADINPLLEGAILLAIDELSQGHVTVAMDVLLAAKLTRQLYDRARAEKDLERLRAVAMAAASGYER